MTEKNTFNPDLPFKCIFCQKEFLTYEECDTLGSDSGICCPDCGSEDFENLETSND